MGTKEKQKGILLEEIPNEIETDYADKDIVLIGDIRKIPEELYKKPLAPHFYIFILCLKGKLQIEFRTETIVLNPNEVLCNNSNAMLKKCMISPDFESRILGLSPQIVSRLLHSSKNTYYNNFYMSQNPILNIGEEGRKLFMGYLELLEYKLKQEKHLFYKESLLGLISSGLYDLHAYFTKLYSTADKKDVLTQGDLLFKRFIDTLSKDDVKVRKVSYYADKLCISAKYLSTVIKEISGKTAHEWIDEYVISDIEYHLRHTEKTIKEIAEYLGFENLSFFGKYVKKHLGKSPTDYRKELEKQLV